LTEPACITYFPGSLDGGTNGSPQHFSAINAINGKVCFVNVSVENLAPCKKLVRVEVEAQQVDETFATITKDFQRQANLPGFRPGKAPAKWSSANTTRTSPTK